MQRLWLAAVVAVLIGCAPANAAVVISEFLAQNDGGLQDTDGETPDWIELHNTGASSVDLANWHLTDNATNFTKWTFPSTNIASGGYLVVFASGKNRATNGVELHTNFQLDESGGYLALVMPDGTTIAHAITYPNQRANVSYGPASTNAPTVTLLYAHTAPRWFVPTNGALGATWTAPGFDGSGWSNATPPLSFNSGPAPGAPVLSLDFNDDDSGESGAANTETGFSTMTLSANPSTFGAITVQLSALSGGVLDDRDRAVPAQTTTLTLDQIYDDFIFVLGQTNGNGARIQISGLAPSTNYQLTVWSYDNSSGGARVSDWVETASGVPRVITNGYTFDGTVLPTRDTDDTFGGVLQSSPTGALTIEGRRSGGTSHGVFLNGLQLAPFSGFVVSGNLATLFSNNASVYARYPFSVSSTNGLASLTLRVNYNDGFVAYLNGTEVARRNAPELVDWDSAATASHSAAVAEDIVIPTAVGLLALGTNVLAVQGLNLSPTNGDFFLEPQLIGTLTLPATNAFYSPPTPGTPNGVAYFDVVADTKFSVDRGFYDTPFSLSITSATPSATIYFTTNGSAPSPGNGAVFTSPISISGNSFIRAAAFVSGLVPSDVDTHSYIFLRDVLRQSNNIPNYPAIWAQGSYPADYEMDSNVVNHPFYGATISNDLRSIPVLSIVTEFDGLWGNTRGIYTHPTSTHDLDFGQDWERAASAELILPQGTNGATAFAVNCGVRMQGNASRDNARTPKHSFRLLFKSEYGPTKLRYDWFPGRVDAFDNIILRAAGFVDGWPSRYSDSTVFTGASGESVRGQRYRPENSSYLRDGFAKATHRDMGWLASRGTWVHLYINGLYWGIYNPCERLDSTFMAKHVGGLGYDWDVLVGDDNVFNAAVADGSKNDWNGMMAVVNAGVTNESAYQAVAQLVDIDNLIDYMLLHIFIESEDWPHHNWYAAHRRANPTNGLPSTQWTFLTWDQELSLDRQVRRDRVNVGDSTSPNHLDSPAHIYSRLRIWPEFRVRFGDRAQAHLFNDGALTPSNNVARLMNLAAAITNALVGESARWGDAREFTIGANPGTGQTFTRDEWWVPEIRKLTTNFLQTLNGVTIARLQANQLYPAISAPMFNQFGGVVTNGFALTLMHTNASGTIYFTVDGNDPRTYGSSSVAPTAQAYATPVPINTPTLIRARVLIGATWSALVETTFYPPQDLSKLALTEIMYNPPAGGGTNGDEFEFLELKNCGTNTLNLTGLWFTDGINLTLTNGTSLAPGQFFVIARNAAAFASKYPGVMVNGVYVGKLENSGEKLTLSHPSGTVIFSVTYDNIAPWPVASDGYGFSLVPKIPGLTQAPDDGTKWRASAFPGGSPGADDPAPGIAPIVINEVITHTLPPAIDRIELFNPATTNVDISGWFLTDDHDIAKKFRITNGTLIGAGGVITFDETQFNPTPGIGLSFSLNSHGDQLYLFSADLAGNLTGYSHGFSFGGAATGVSFGRYVNSVGDEQFPAQITTSFNNVNSGPRVGPVVINEIHYHPALGGDEFVELKNISTTNVPLFHPAFATNTWKLEGVNYTLPPITLQSNGLLLLVATNVNYFRTKYSVPTNVLVLSYLGNLQQSGERLDLTRPDAPDTNGVSRISVDTVRYNDKLPWPPAADGSGPSLQRKVSSQYGDDPINWQAAAPTPGTENAEADTDGDGIPDAWEVATATDPLVPDANNDDDGDGLTNLQEYLAGTHPHDPDSYLRVDAGLTGNSVQLQFSAVSNRTYHVLFKDTLTNATWSPLTNISAAPLNRAISINDLRTNNSRFYRITAP